jgi:hypothetical protein
MMFNMSENLLSNLEKIHTTELGAVRVARNIGLGNTDVIAWCKAQVKKADGIVHRGKNWYVYSDGCVITINAYSYTIITAHRSV